MDPLAFTTPTYFRIRITSTTSARLTFPPWCSFSLRAVKLCRNAMAAQTTGTDAADAHVDTSLLKLPGIQAEDKQVATGEENEEEIYSQ